MNIIELFEKAGIYAENQSGFNFEDTVKVKKQLEVERTNNPNLDTNIATNLIAAMNENPNELLFISNNRILYNFFAKTNHSRNRFVSDLKIDESKLDIQNFIEKHLKIDLEAYFDEKISKNRFEELDNFLTVKEFLPQSSLNKLSTKLAEKFDEVLDAIEKNAIDISTFTFIKQRSFYDLLSQFKSVENDRRVKELLNVMTSTLVSLDIKVVYLNPMMLAMGNYKPINDDLAYTLKTNKDETEIRTQKVSSSSSSALSTGGTIVMVIIVIRIILLMARCSQ
ncbi:hypothetical protein OX283_002215 [Flavobacterium sp. SUN052]|uniref:hypothetical protein n=1 Tax=Flavobacterium sp. SUN052 TaxID=3002441 RepID=UPI00237EDF78|nr:hypothetical protein [Flavobacterium sp. SUN052]MEC4003459.1 hypothetical protein [Flavobacterium sp. SUN052]